MAGDLRALFGFSPEEVWEPSGLTLATQLIDRLAFEPRSIWRARQIESVPAKSASTDTALPFFAWDETSNALALIADELQALRNQVAAMGSGKRPRKITPYPRPTKRKKHTPKSLDQVNWDFFNF